MYISQVMTNYGSFPHMFFHFVCLLRFGWFTDIWLLQTHFSCPGYHCEQHATIHTVLCCPQNYHRLQIDHDRLIFALPVSVWRLFWKIHRDRSHITKPESLFICSLTYRSAKNSRLHNRPTEIIQASGQQNTGDPKLAIVGCLIYENHEEVCIVNANILKSTCYESFKPVYFLNLLCTNQQLFL